MTQERLQEIKDSISLQYKVQEANYLHNFNIFTNEEQELVEEVERLNNIINELEKWLDENINNDGLSIYASEKYEEVLDKLQELKGSDSNE